MVQNSKTNEILVAHHNKLCEMLGNLTVALKQKQKDVDKLQKDIANVEAEIEALGKSVQFCQAVEKSLTQEQSKEHSHE